MHPGLRPNVHPQPVPPTKSVVARAISQALPAIGHGLPAVIARAVPHLPGSAPWASPGRTPALLPRHLRMPTSHQDAGGPRWWTRPGSPATLLPGSFCVHYSGGAAVNNSPGPSRHQDPAGRITGSVSGAGQNPRSHQDAVGSRWWARPGSPTTLLPSTFCVMAGSGAAVDASPGRKRHQDPAGRMTGSVSGAGQNPRRHQDAGGPRWWTRPSSPATLLPSTLIGAALVMAPRWWKRYTGASQVCPIPIRPW